MILVAVVLTMGLATGVEIGRQADAGSGPLLVSADGSEPLGAAANVGFGRKVVFVGDSITVGAGADRYDRRFWWQTRHILGTANMSSDSAHRGVAGDKSADVLARIDAVLAEGWDAMVLLIGTNDAGTLVPTNTYAANVEQIVERARQTGVPTVVGTVPPAGANRRAEIHERIVSYNIWLRSWAPSAGVRLADVHGRLVDPATGFLADQFNTDGVHPSNLGHLEIARAFADVIADLLPPQPWLVRSKDAVNLVADPLMSAQTVSGAGWIDLGGNGPASWTFEADTTGTLVAGRWLVGRMTGPGYRSAGVVLDRSKYDPGDQLLIVAHIQGAGFKLQFFDGYQVKQPLIIVDGALTRPDEVGPVMMKVKAPETSSSLRLGVTLGSARIGGFGVYNLTRLGNGFHP